MDRNTHSTEPSDGLFADGLSEEILASLAAISELKVPGRTSSFAWKDKSVDVREIATALGVAHVLEGSIRRSGQQLRITANLIGAADGSTLWTQTFDRTDDDVFVIQNEIAIAVSDRLSVQVGTRSLPTLARLPAELRGPYLETIGALRTLPSTGMAALAESLRRIEASGHAGPDLYVRLLHTNAHRARNESLDYDDVLAEQDRYLLALNSRFAGSIESLLGQAIVRQTRGDAGFRVDDYEAALSLYSQALQLVPNDPLATTQAAFAARTLLRHDRALALARQAVALDPQDPGAHFALATTLGSAGHGDEAVAAMAELKRRFPDSGYVRNMSTFLAANGQLADAALTDRDCMERTAGQGCATLSRILRLLEFHRSADALHARRPESVRLDADGYLALRSGQFPDPKYATLGPMTAIEALSEAVAQHNPDLGRSYLDAGRLRSRLRADLSATPPQELDMRAALSFVGIALTASSDNARKRSPQDLAAVMPVVHAIPAKTMPFPIVHWALGAEILSGDLDAAFRRLDGMVDLNPLHWQYWVVSPSGRDMPTAEVLRADPRFAAIWAKRAALIERERARLKQLWPEVE